MMVRLLASPNFSSLLYCSIRLNICGRNAAIVSPFSPGGKWPATNRPSCIAISAPATPLSPLVLCTISLGVQFFRPGWPKTSPISSGGGGAGTAATAGAAGASGATGGLTGAIGAGMEIDGAAGAVAGAATCAWADDIIPLLVNRS